MKHRPAFTLVEMLVVISVGSVLLVLSMGTVHRMMRIETATRENANYERAAIRLARQFRDDVHQANKVEIEKNQQGEPVLSLSFADQPPATYRQDDAGLLREQEQDSQVWREHFLLAGNSNVEFAELVTPPRAVLKVNRNQDKKGFPERTTLHVEAVVGQYDLRGGLIISSRFLGQRPFFTVACGNATGQRCQPTVWLEAILTFSLKVNLAFSQNIAWYSTWGCTSFAPGYDESGLRPNPQVIIALILSQFTEATR